MSAHLGDRVSALADGQLPPAAAERALAHVAGCRLCAGELAAARAARRVLSDAADVQPAGDLTARLLALGCGSDGAADRPMAAFVPPSSTRPRPVAFPSATPPRGSFLGLLSAPALGGHGALTGSVAPGRRGMRAVVGSVTGLGVVAAGLFVLGGRPAIAPSAQPSEALHLLGTAEAVAVPAAAPSDAAPASGSSTDDYLAWMRAEGWTCPQEVPAGFAVTSVRLRDEGRTLEVAVTGPVGDLVLTEQQGQLDADALTAADRLTVGDRTVYLLSSSPWHVAWQAGDTVVELVSADGSGDVTAVVAQFPESAFDTGLPARLTRGWDTLAAAVHLP